MPFSILRLMLTKVKRVSLGTVTILSDLETFLNFAMAITSNG